MKKTIAIVLGVLVLAAVFAVSQRAAGQGASVAPEATAELPQVEFRTTMDKVSYAIGLDIGTNLRMQKLDVNPTIVARGIADALAEREPLLSEEEMGRIMQEFQQSYAAEMETEMTELAVANLAKAVEFLADNALNVGVETTDSGLQYMIIADGDGPRPTAEDVVKVHYVGRLVDGTEFDSSVKRGEPATFQVGGVITGWQEAIKLMKVGSKWRLFIPPGLAYGDRGAGQMIQPNSVLIFEVELLSIEPVPAQ